MADFRKYFYALAVVALLAGLTMPASAQPFQCTNSSGVPPTVRAEGYAELMGDLVLDCTGGIPTAPNQQVQQVNISVNLDTFVSSKVTRVVGTNTEFLESLLIIDEPNSASNPTRAIRNCGFNGEDTTSAGPGVCSFVGGGSNGAATTYDGTAAGKVNVFQGRSLALINGQTNQVVFLGVPIDPPGTICPNQSSQPVCHRIIRITNIRGDASTTGVAQGNQTSSITAQIIVNPSSGLPIDNPSHVVARVQLGLVVPSLTNNNIAGGKFDFIQCNLLEASSQNQGLVYTFREAFANAFKPKSLQQVFNNGVTNPYNYTSGNTPNTSSATTTNQNVPGATYDTESGFMNSNAPAGGNPPTNPLIPGTGNGAIFTDTTVVTSGTGIVAAGVATQGTRLALNFANVPVGSTLAVPNLVLLKSVINTTQTTGVAILVTGTAASGSGGTPVSTNLLGTTFVAGSQVPGASGTLGQRAVYEVFFSNPGALEQLSVPITVVSTCNQSTFTTPCPNLPGNLPTPNSTATVQGGFAPSYAASLAVRTAALEASGNSESASGSPASLPVPRFQNLQAPVNLFQIVRCSCNLLFPFVTNAPTAGGNYDTGMAIANTSLDPGAGLVNGFGFRATPQTGPIQLWYYNSNGTPNAVPNFLNQLNTQCTNATTPGSCASVGALTPVPAGGMLTYVLSSGGVIAPSPTVAGPSVLLGAPGFQGYIIAQAGFQYCHGFAFISRQGAGFDATNFAMGYLAIVLDTAGLPRTFSTGENDAH